MPFLPSSQARPFALCGSALSGLLLATSLGAQQPVAVGGVVVDAESGEPIPGVEVRIDEDLVTVTDEAGEFQLGGIPAGSRVFAFRHIAYGEHERSLALEEGTTLQYEIRMSREAIELSPIVVDVADAYGDEVFRGGGNPANVIDARTIEEADRRGLSLMSLLRQEVAGIRFRSRPGGASCIEYRARGGADAIGVRPPWLPPEEMNLTCRQMAVVVDGVRVQESAGLLLEPWLWQLERVEVLSPSQAGLLYGTAGAYGVLLLETKQGLAPEFDPDRVKVTGFEWHDEQPYRWARVLGVSFAANATAAALTFGVLIDCRDGEAALHVADTCKSPFATAAGLLTGTLGGLLTSWAGKSTSTQGRIFPQVLVGAASATTGYVLLTRSDMGSFDGDDVPGLLLASAATSALTTLADRVFRVMR